MAALSTPLVFDPGERWAYSISIDWAGLMVEAAHRHGATAVLFPQWMDFLPAIAYFSARGLEFPRDLSVVALIGVANSRSYAPPIAGCLSSPDSFAQQAEVWVRSEKIEHDVLISVYNRTWESGGSIGPAPSRR